MAGLALATAESTFVPRERAEGYAQRITHNDRNEYYDADGALRYVEELYMDTDKIHYGYPVDKIGRKHGCLYEFDEDAQDCIKKRLDYVHDIPHGEGTTYLNGTRLYVSSYINGYRSGEQILRPDDEAEKIVSYYLRDDECSLNEWTASESALLQEWEQRLTALRAEEETPKETVLSIDPVQEEPVRVDTPPQLTRLTIVKKQQPAPTGIDEELDREDPLNKPYFASIPYDKVILGRNGTRKFTDANGKVLWTQKRRGDKTLEEVRVMSNQAYVAKRVLEFNIHGRLAKDTPYQAGSPHGIAKTYDAEGMESLLWYRNGQSISEEAWKEASRRGRKPGTTNPRPPLTPRDQTMEAVRERNRLTDRTLRTDALTEWPTIDDHADGRWFKPEYRGRSLIALRGYNANNEPDGAWREFNPSTGEVITTSRYQDGRRHGPQEGPNGVSHFILGQPVQPRQWEEHLDSFANWGTRSRSIATVILDEDNIPACTTPPEFGMDSEVIRNEIERVKKQHGEIAKRLGDDKLRMPHNSSFVYYTADNITEEWGRKARVYKDANLITRCRETFHRGTSQVENQDFFDEDGFRDGECKTFHSNGKIASSTCYIPSRRPGDEMKHGFTVLYDLEGKPIHHEYYDYDRKIPRENWAYMGLKLPHEVDLLIEKAGEPKAIIAPSVLLEAGIVHSPHLKDIPPPAHIFHAEMEDELEVKEEELLEKAEQQVEEPLAETALHPERIFVSSGILRTGNRREVGQKRVAPNPVVKKLEDPAACTPHDSDEAFAYVEIHKDGMRVFCDHKGKRRCVETYYPGPREEKRQIRTQIFLAKDGVSPHGTSTTWETGGDVASTIPYRNKCRHGKAEFYDPEGNLKEIYYFEGHEVEDGAAFDTACAARQAAGTQAPAASKIRVRKAKITSATPGPELLDVPTAAFPEIAAGALTAPIRLRAVPLTRIDKSHPVGCNESADRLGGKASLHKINFYKGEGADLYRWCEESLRADGTVSFQVFLDEEGHVHGTRTNFYPGNRPKTVTTMHHGEETGLYSEFNPDGLCTLSGSQEKSERVGIWDSWNKNDIWTPIYYIDGLEVNEIAYQENLDQLAGRAKTGKPTKERRPKIP